MAASLLQVVLLLSFTQTPVISSDVGAVYDLTCIHLTANQLEDESPQLTLLMRCGAISIHELVHTALMKMFMTREGTSPSILPDSIIIRRTRDFQLDQSDGRECWQQWEDGFLLYIYIVRLQLRLVIIPLFWLLQRIAQIDH